MITMLEINDLKKTFKNGSTALKGVSLRFNKGEYQVILYTNNYEIGRSEFIIK